MNGETRFDRLMKLKEKIEKYQSEINELRAFLASLKSNGTRAISYSSRGTYIGYYAEKIIEPLTEKICKDAEKRIQYLEALIHNTKKMF